MKPDNNSDAHGASSSLGLTVGSAAGALIGLFASQIEDKGTRQIFSALAPVVAVVVSALVTAWEGWAREWWRDYKHNNATLKATRHAQKVIDDSNATAELKQKAVEMRDKAQLARMNFHADNLNKMAGPPTLPRKRPAKIAQSDKDE